jgi:hypothetical protein
MKTKLHILALLIFNLSLVYAQITPTPAPTGFATASANIRVFPSSDLQSEEMISFSKSQPGNLLISTNVNSGHQGFYLSSDYGSTWPTGGDDLPNWGVTGNMSSACCDPATSYDEDGNAYIATLSADRSQFLVQESSDNGSSWSNQVPAISSLGSGNCDKDMAFAFDEMGTSAQQMTLYCAYSDVTAGGSTVNFNESTDMAAPSSFTTAAPLDDHDFGLSQAAIIATGPDGQIYVCWATRDLADVCSCGNEITITQGVGFVQSTDGGSTFTSTAQVATIGPGEVDLRNSGFTSPYAGTSVFFYPSMAVDKSCGPNRGTIYIAYPNLGSGSSSEAVIMVISSLDGVTWTSPTTVSIATGIQSWMPTIAVDDETGLVNVIYYSLDNTTVTNSTDTYVAYSTDGATTWENLKVSDASHIHGPVGCTDCRAGYCGEYIGLASFGGSSYAVWHDNRPVSGTSAGPWNLYFSKIDYNMPLLTSSSTNLAVNAPTISNTQTFQAAEQIEVANSHTVEITSTGNVTIVAGENIVFNSGFTADDGSYLDAYINSAASPCQTPGAPSFLTGPKQPNGNLSFNTATSNTNLSSNCYPNPTSEYITFVASANTDNETLLAVSDIQGRVLYTTNTSVFYNNGNRFVYDASSLASGIYLYTMVNESGSFSGKFVKQ